MGRKRRLTISSERRKRIEQNNGSGSSRQVARGSLEADEAVPRELQIAHSSRRMKGRMFQNDEEVQEHHLGEMSVFCEHCNARNFACEKVQGGFTICCHKGKIKSDIVSPIEVPELLRKLITENDDESKHYLNNIRSYNNALAFASVQANICTFKNRGPYCYKIHGQLYHSVGTLHPDNGNPPKYAGLFILDSESALNYRMNGGTHKECKTDVMTSLMNMLHNVNPYAKLFQHMVHVEENLKLTSADSVPTYHLTFSVDNTFDKRRYNPSTTGEIAAVFLSDDGTPPNNISFTIHSKASGHQVKRISALNPHTDPMSYPLLFPCGEPSWRLGMNHDSVHTTSVRNVVTQLQYYSYRLAVRDDFSLLHSSGRLFQQYVVDAYVKVEGSRIAYVMSHQKQLRAENYKGLMDFLSSEAQERGIRAGIPVVLPSTFIGSPRNMLQNYQDAMSIVARFGKPDLFITFTANPKWKEIVNNVPYYQKPENRPDLISRVFYQKLIALMSELTEGQIFGVVTAHVHVIEFQKRGLPHAHILVVLKDEDKIREVEDIDSIVMAELPDVSINPQLHNIVSRCMIHGPCGSLNPAAPCMENGICTKGFPKEFVSETHSNVNGYPIYRRRDDNKIVFRNGVQVDNRWIVPYNPYLTLRFNAHINVEVCSSIRSIKYVFKYVYKGYDCAALNIRQNTENEATVSVNEASAHINARYVSPAEAVWRLHERYMQKKSHTIERLPVHLPQEQTVYFETGNETRLNSASARETKLTGWFALNEIDVFAKDILYKDIPEHYIWSNNKWQRRKRSSKSIGRMFTVNPSDRERFFLRILLLHRKGVSSYEELRTINGQEYETFFLAAKALHLVEDDDEWNDCLEEASLFHMPQKLRQLFAYICIFCNPSNIVDMWEKFKNNLCEDFKLSHSDEFSQHLALSEVNNILKSHGLNCSKLNLPEPLLNSRCSSFEFNTEDEIQKGKTLYASLNHEQKCIVDEVLGCIKYGHSKCWFIDGPGGTGKTFIYKCILHSLRGETKIVLPVAWTGIAATLLEGGRTAHSIFKLPIPMLENSVSSLRPNSTEADNLRKAHLIVWDEVSMVPRLAITVVNKLLQDIMQSQELFGGKCILFGGDFRQILPVVRRGNRVTICEQILKSSELWPFIHQCRITKK